jgi:hypothetical protein
MKKTKSQIEKPIPANDRRNSSSAGKALKIVGIDLFVSWDKEKVIELVGTSCHHDGELQLQNVTDALQQKGFKILWCGCGSLAHIILTKDRRVEAIRTIKEMVAGSYHFCQHGSLLSYQDARSPQGIPTCHEEGCELTDLYLPELMNKLRELVDPKIEAGSLAKTQSESHGAHYQHRL